MVAEPQTIEQVQHLRKRALHHKRQERFHRRAALECYAQADQLMEQFRRLGVPVVEEAEPKEAEPYDGYRREGGR